MNKLVTLLLLSSNTCLAQDLVGTWEDRSGGIFGGESGWDECEFRYDNTFKCTNYPKLGCLVLPFEGAWELIGNTLILRLDGSYIVKAHIAEIDKDFFRGLVENGNKFTFSRQKP
ncbi:lipocalin family protein [Microbulbifer sp. MKSA007]|uniref:lipocalin family protein n=1 Tax=unclassified Microbulbifer TaxID=2619833 RepID=UPI002B2939F0|nr:lipocalin family protein [Microbulbifer sp. MKSA007]